jgi:hypothetical protein
MTTPSDAGQTDSKMPGMPTSAKRHSGKIIGILLLAIVVAILIVGVSRNSLYAPPTDCAEQIANWAVDETSPVDPGCR